MGGGSTMTYTATRTSGYNVDQLKGLMENIRIVLFNPDSLAIYGYARLDVSEATVSDDGSGEISVTMPIKMCSDAGVFTVNAEGKADATITKLVQNEATAVSSLVYLDGVNLTNADVGNASIQGTMNMQFASSAELVPMEYSNLHISKQVNVTAPTGLPTAVVFSGASSTAINKAYAFSLTGNDADKYTYAVTYSVDVEEGTDITNKTLEATNGNNYVIPKEDVKGNITITVTATAKPAQQGS
jgi:hypothetical protein